MNVQSVAPAIKPTKPSPLIKKGWKNPHLKLERLDMLIAHIETIPPRAFKMNIWFKRNGSEQTPTPAEALEIVQTQAATGPNHKGAPVCGTAACIAGEAVLVKMACAVKEGKKARVGRRSSIDYSGVAQEWLGLMGWEARKLFAPAHLAMNRIKKERALRVLRYLRETGAVTWDVPRNWKPTYVPFTTQSPFLVAELPEPETAA